jgi:replicative DNA helicase
MVDIRTAPPPFDDEAYAASDAQPSAVFAEAALLGGILHNSRAYDSVYDIVGERDFYNRDHRSIWALLAKQIERNKPADAITILDLADDQTRQALLPIMHGTPSVVRVVDYAKIVREKSILRSLIAAGREIAEQASEHGIDAQDAAERAEARVLSILDKEARDESREPVTLYQAFSQAVDWLDAEHKDGLPTGIHGIDAMLAGGGLQPEQLIVIAGRPSMGKSSLAYQIAERAARAGKGVAYFALETSVREIGVRGIRYHEAKVGRGEALRMAADVPMVIDDMPAIGLSHIRVRCRRIRRQKGLGLIVVDYLQLMKQRAQNRLEEISEISRGLKAIAKEFGVPVIAVSQLNRSVEQRPDKRPVLSDLRESGQIEQDADVVLMCYRDEYYNADSPEKGFGDVFLRKNRDGRVGGVFLRWNGEFTRWHNFDGERPMKASPQAEEGQQGRRLRSVSAKPVQDWGPKE